MRYTFFLLIFLLGSCRHITSKTHELKINVTQWNNKMLNSASKCKCDVGYDEINFLLKEKFNNKIRANVIAKLQNDNSLKLDNPIYLIESSFPGSYTYKVSWYQLEYQSSKTFYYRDNKLEEANYSKWDSNDYNLKKINNLMKNENLCTVTYNDFSSGYYEIISVYNQKSITIKKILLTL